MSATLAMPIPMIIQGGMGIGISDWKLARAVSQRGQLGVVSGTCIDTLFVRRLQDGDIGGHLRRAMAAFPIPGVSAEALRRYFQPGGRAPGTPYRLLSLWNRTVSRAREQLTMLASFVEVYLAKEGHNGPVGINLLTKVQLPNLATLYGAMLAGVDCVLMGAGIPKEIPGVLDALSAHAPAAMRFEVEGRERGGEEELRFDPRVHWEAAPPPLKRPAFLPIIASNSLATMLARRANGRIDGFVVEGPTAGGHNAPPRGRLEVNGRGEPVYGGRDEVDLAELKRLGLPFWLAGGAGSPAALEAALAAGAAGVQVGTLFACAKESGFDPDLKRRILAEVRAGRADVLTDLRASPTGFPFKVVQLEATCSEPERYLERQRICDLGYLRTPYRREDGRIGFRCPAEPAEAYVKKGGALEETRGRKCMCNALLAAAGHPQLREDGPELPLVTAGDCLVDLHAFLNGRDSYSAGEAIDWLLSGVAATAC